MLAEETTPLLGLVAEAGSDLGEAADEVEAAVSIDLAEVRLTVGGVGVEGLRFSDPRRGVGTLEVGSVGFDGPILGRGREMMEGELGWSRELLVTLVR